MVEEGYITQAEADAANNEPLPTHPAAGGAARPTNYLVAEVQDSLLDRHPRSATRAEGAPRQDLKGGLKVYTTFDPRLQELAERRDRRTPSPAARARLGVVAGGDRVRHRRGEGDGRRPRTSSRSQNNIATHAHGRQTGSTLKVITLAAALVDGYSAERHRRRIEPVPGAESQFPGMPPNDVPEELGGQRRASTTIRAADAGLGELRVRAPGHQRRPRQGHRHGPRDGHHPGPPAAHPQPHARHRRGRTPPTMAR